MQSNSSIKSKRWSRAYIYYSLEDIMEALGCSNKKAISIMKELDTDAGIGLIEKKRQGQGKPTMIYLKQFMVQDVQKCRKFTSEQKAAVSEVKNLHIHKIAAMSVRMVMINRSVFHAIKSWWKT